MNFPIMFARIAAAYSLLIWVYLVFARGRFWQLPLIADIDNQHSFPMPRIAVVVPARNEADVIQPVIRSLLAQDFDGPFHIFVVDDHSTDDTAQVARRAASESPEKVTILSAEPLPAGWKGKMWALAQGSQEAAQFQPDYFLFTDADIVHHPTSLSNLVNLAQNEGLDLVSMMVKLRCESFAERLLIPAFVFFFFMLYPPDWVRDSRHRSAAAAGGDILVRSDALRRIGGISAIRNELIDDCALARKIKEGGKIRLGLTTDAASIRGYGGFAGIGSMISRTAFYQLRHSVLLLLLTLCGLVITYMAPPLLLFLGGWASLGSALAWCMMAMAICPMLRFFSVSRWWALFLPLIAAFYAGATIHSAIQYWFGKGGNWKDRAQDVN